MTRHALSREAHAQKNSCTWQQLYENAREAWQKAQGDAASTSSAPSKLAAFLRDFPGVKRSTFQCHLQGGISRNDYAVMHKLLTKAQTESLIKFIVEMGEKGFPLTLKKVSKYALAMIRVKDPTKTSIGMHWAQCFVQCYETDIGMKTCTLLDCTWAKALNPTIVSSHFELLSKTITQYNITEHNLYNCDETGCPLNIPFQEKVILSKNSKSK